MVRRSLSTLVCRRLAAPRSLEYITHFDHKERRLQKGLCIWRNEVRVTGLEKGTIGSLYLWASDSLAVGDGSLSSFRLAYMGGCGTGRGAKIRSAGSSICMRNGGGHRDCKGGLKGIERPGGAEVDA